MANLETSHTAAVWLVTPYFVWRAVHGTHKRLNLYIRAASLREDSIDKCSFLEHYFQLPV